MLCLTYMQVVIKKILSLPLSPSSKIVAPIRWELENTIRQAQAQEPDTDGGPTNRLFSPKSVRSQVLQWGHFSHLTCHPGTIRTLEFLQRRFWWLTIKEDTKSFVTACHLCNQGKVSHRSPQGLLHPLSIPQRPWSHLSMDFITGPPPSQGNTTIMVIVDIFSMAGRFIPLPKLPTAKETAELIINHVFRVYGIPRGTLFLIEALSFPLDSGRHSVNFWG